MGKASPEAKKLWQALRKKGFRAFYEKWDGHKTIDIAIPEVKMNIEVDGGQHNFNPKQALADLKRTYYSFNKGYFTLRIPNSLIRNHFDEALNLIVEILDESGAQLDEDDY
ncbi:DUF559 domain-containing protein [Candidatus Woesearchaeota archaeon]|nr:DUF559 domain-containing protein [Candidatus Woesearchaeota archaeon]